MIIFSTPMILESISFYSESFYINDFIYRISGNTRYALHSSLPLCH